jgi:hypothetical protein
MVCLCVFPDSFHKVRFTQKGVHLMTQEILLVIPGADGEGIGHKAVFEPDTIVADLLHAADLPPGQWQLQVKRGEKLIALRSDDKLSDHVQAGEKVYATSTEMVVGVVA